MDLSVWRHLIESLAYRPPRPTRCRVPARLYATERYDRVIAKGPSVSDLARLEVRAGYTTDARRGAASDGRASCHPPRRHAERPDESALVFFTTLHLTTAFLRAVLGVRMLVADRGDLEGLLRCGSTGMTAN